LKLLWIRTYFNFDYPSEVFKYLIVLFNIKINCNKLLKFIYYFSKLLTKQKSKLIISLLLKFILLSLNLIVHSHMNLFDHNNCIYKYIDQMMFYKMCIW